MKFSCERCGKKYATAENPSPGRVYKLKCKACGHLIVVKVPAGAAPATAAAQRESPPPAKPPPLRAATVRAEPPPEPSAAETGPSAPEVELDVAPPQPAEPALPPQEVSLEVDAPAPAAVAPPFADEPPHAASADALPQPDALLAGSPERGIAAPAGGEHAPPDAGYVDLFSDVAAAEDAERRPEDPFLAAARASLPDGYGSGNPAAPDPFAALRDDPAPPPPPPQDAPPAPLPKIPAFPKPPAQRSALPFVLIGAGGLVLLGILGFVVLRTGGAPAPVQAQPQVQAPSPAPAPAPPPPLAPAAEPPVVEAAVPAQPEPPPPAPAEAKAAPEPARATSGEERRAREERRRRERAEAQERAERARAEAQERAERARQEREAREREARAQREQREQERLERARAERETREREARERDRQERERVAAAAAAEEADGALTQEQIEGTLRATKKAFDACINAARGGDVKLDGRRVLLRLNIQPSGTVTYPTLDDVTLTGTELGSCLKSAARLMVFPKFKGETMHVEVPLVMR